MGGGWPARPDTDTSIQGEGTYYALRMTASAATASRELIYIPDVATTRFYLGALAKLSVLQYFVAEAAVIGAWAAPERYSRRTGYISDLGALRCGEFSGRDVCSPAHLLMNASFVVQGIGMMVGALLLSSAVLGVAARAGARLAVARCLCRALAERYCRRGHRSGGTGAGRRRLRLASGGRADVFRCRRPGLVAGRLAVAPPDTPGLVHPWLRRRFPGRAGGGRPDGDEGAGTGHAGTADGIPHHHRHGGAGAGRGAARPAGARCQKAGVRGIEL